MAGRRYLHCARSLHILLATELLNPLRGAYAGAICMSAFVQRPAPLRVPRVHPSLMPHWLTHLGALGLFCVAVVDSSVIPLPLPGSTDLLLLWLVAHSGNPWLLAPCAIAGSILGGYTTWHIGRRGGEAALRNYVPTRLLGRVVTWVERHPVLAVFLPAVLPPPFPLLPFALASGALGVSRRRFLVVFGAARSLRYSFIAWLGVTYGRRIVRMWSGTLQRWSTPLRCVFVGLLVAGTCYVIWKIRGLRKIEAAQELA
jgi:membrane protein YqaA with SNARE-associated domain